MPPQPIGHSGEYSGQSGPPFRSFRPGGRSAATPIVDGILYLLVIEANNSLPLCEVIVLP